MSRRRPVCCCSAGSSGKAGSSPAPPGPPGTAPAAPTHSLTSHPPVGRVAPEAPATGVPAHSGRQSAENSEKKPLPGTLPPPPPPTGRSYPAAVQAQVCQSASRIMVVVVVPPAVVCNGMAAVAMVCFHGPLWGCVGVWCGGLLCWFASEWAPAPIRLCVPARGWLGGWMAG